MKQFSSNVNICSGDFSVLGSSDRMLNQVVHNHVILHKVSSKQELVISIVDQTLKNIYEKFPT